MTQEKDFLFIDDKTRCYKEHIEQIKQCLTPGIKCLKEFVNNKLVTPYRSIGDNDYMDALAYSCASYEYQGLDLDVALALTLDENCCANTINIHNRTIDLDSPGLRLDKAIKKSISYKNKHYIQLDIKGYDYGFYILKNKESSIITKIMDYIDSL